jgi:hypothetical protein
MAAWTCRQFAGKAAQEIVPPRPRNPCWKGLRADSEEKREPVSDFNTGVVDRLKALDPERTIREAAMMGSMEDGGISPCVDGSHLARAFCLFCVRGRCCHVFGLT